jgi:hypothetical protein
MSVYVTITDWFVHLFKGEEDHLFLLAFDILDLYGNLMRNAYV